MRKDGDCQRQDRKGGEKAEGAPCWHLISHSLGAGGPPRQRGGKRRVVQENYARAEQKPSWLEFDPDSQNGAR